MSKIDYQALRGAAEAIKIAAIPQKLLAFRMKVTPQVVLALLDERDALNERLAELEADLAGLAEDQQKSIESIKQADEAVKLAHEKFSALAAENELARKAVQAFCDVVGDNTEVIAEVVGRDSVLVILEDMKATGNMPATDAFLAEVRAQGVEMLAKNHQSIVNALKGDSLFSDGEYRHAAIVSAAVYFAAELRKGGNQ
ncbi:TPA: ead/Ea22-like family protein [Escherichia coli]|nr:ead/Ea22-like family protein [Escherichia coli]